MNTLTEITTADRELLIQRWESLFEREPPPQIHTALMRRVVAWNVQMQQAGLDPFADRQPGSRPPVPFAQFEREVRAVMANTGRISAI